MIGTGWLIHAGVVFFFLVAWWAFRVGATCWQDDAIDHGFAEAARRDEEWTLLFGNDINAAHGDLIAAKSEAALYEVQYVAAVAQTEKAERERDEWKAAYNRLLEITKWNIPAESKHGL